MRKVRHYILVCVMSLFAFVGCDIHEFPDPQSDALVPFNLHLTFDTEMSFHTEVPYTRNGDGDTKAPSSRHDFRYVINAYRTDGVVRESRVVDTTFIFTKSDLSNLNFVAPLKLREGSYTFRVWCDYVDVGSTSDKYYDTRDFSKIILTSRDNHAGSNDYRDAFRGTSSATIINPAFYTGARASSIENEAYVEMKRPMGKYQFISTDVEAFLTRVMRMLQDRGVLNNNPNELTFEQMLQSVDLEEFEVIMHYNYFMPREFNMFTDKPGDSWEKVSYKSSMKRVNNTEMLLGHDFVFVNGTETTLSIFVEVKNAYGEQMSLSKPVDVPIVRNKLTTVRGEFLTSKATGGVGINPGYDGDDYNIEL